MNQRPPSPLLREDTQNSVPSEPEMPLILMMANQATSHLHLSLILEKASQRILTRIELDENSPPNTIKEPNTQSLSFGPTLFQHKTC